MPLPGDFLQKLLIWILPAMLAGQHIAWLRTPRHTNADTIAPGSILKLEWMYKAAQNLSMRYARWDKDYRPLYNVWPDQVFKPGDARKAGIDFVLSREGPDSTVWRATMRMMNVSAVDSGLYAFTVEYDAPRLAARDDRQDGIGQVYRLTDSFQVVVIEEDAQKLSTSSGGLIVEGVRMLPEKTSYTDGGASSTVTEAVAPPWEWLVVGSLLLLAIAVIALMATLVRWVARLRRKRKLDIYRLRVVRETIV